MKPFIVCKRIRTAVCDRGELIRDRNRTFQIWIHGNLNKESSS
jgi:hypothetical protein